MANIYESFSPLGYISDEKNESLNLSIYKNIPITLLFVKPCFPEAVLSTLIKKLTALLQ